MIRIQKIEEDKYQISLNQPCPVLIGYWNREQLDSACEYLKELRDSKFDVWFLPPAQREGEKWYPSKEKA